MFWYFIFFIISGFCSLVYQVTWVRIAMADFGVTTPSISIVLSIFMAGLALGCWGAGHYLSRSRSENAGYYLKLYAAAEAVIGLSGIVVMPLLGAGRDLLALSTGTTWGSNSYYAASGVIMAVILLPFCTCMGATFPLAMAAVRISFARESSTSFSFLYVANVLGAMGGALISAFLLIELLGFRSTMLVAAALNLLVAIAAVSLSTRVSATTAEEPDEELPGHNASTTAPDWTLLLMLFTTGMISLAMEVVWTRQFVPFQGPVVYTFATILAVYLAATLFGSKVYRYCFRNYPEIICNQGWGTLALLAGTTALLPLVAADYRIPLPNGLLPGMFRVMFGIGPFCAILGFLTPAILDRISSGDPRRAGYGYALNTLGCIVGPLLAGFLLLPLFGEKLSLIVLAVPLFLMAIIPSKGVSLSVLDNDANIFVRKGIIPAIALSLLMVVLTKDFENLYTNRLVLRDHTATVIATGEGMRKRLYVNGVGITHLTPITKMMAHMPLTFLDRPPRNGLVLCLGMGTSFRSMLTWDIPVTVVELVPSVPALLPYFQPDGEQLLHSPKGKIVVDDARRFLERSTEKFDVIVIDPPPPIEAAASSLLYSKEFYSLAAKRLSSDGILQQWIPGGDPYIESSMTKSILDSFPYVRAFRSVDGWGIHLFASRQPIPFRTSAELAARLPPKAADDLVEWGPYATPQDQLSAVLLQHVPTAQILEKAPNAIPISDNRPVNEYYLLRKAFHR